MSKDTKFADSWKAGHPACGNKLQRYTPPDRRFAAKIGGRWRFSDLISYFCNWFRADPRSQTFYTNVLLRFLSHSNFATLISRKECSRALRKRMYCIRALLAYYVQYTFRVGCPCCLFREGQRRPECVVSQCGNPRFLWLSITITPETPPCSTAGRSPSSPTGRRGAGLALGRGVLRNRPRRN